jgi:hypothetical protein
MLNITKLIAPSAWACYLINGDASGIDESDVKAADAWVEFVGMGSPVSCEDYGFCGATRHDASQFCPLAADCQEYVFLSAD